MQKDYGGVLLSSCHRRLHNVEKTENGRQLLNPQVRAMSKADNPGPLSDLTIFRMKHPWEVGPLCDLFDYSLVGLNEGL